MMEAGGSDDQPVPSTSTAEFQCAQPAHDSNNDDSSSQTASEAMEGLWLTDGGIQEQEIEDPDEIGEFFFESDHLALRGNSDYRNTLKTLAVLEAQRVQAIQDIEKLMEIREDALADPIRFVERLQKKEDLGIPLPQLVASLPNIDWSQYSLMGIQQGIEGKRQLTRHAARTEQKDTQSSSQSQGPGGSILIRGRVFNESKPATFNQLWTAEEQKRLEDLLIKFPPEEVESKRWQKIANALGNRTPTQVASRVQKYFIKLAKAGLPVPGRIRTTIAPRKTGSRRGYHRGSLRGSSYLYSHSTFFASHRPPVFMSEADDDCSVSSWGYQEMSNRSHKSEPASSNDDGDEDVQVDASVKESPEYQELMALQKARVERMKRTGLAQHVGFRCDRCECEPIVGTRWHCADCPSNASIDFCSDCVDCMHETATHKEDHHMEAIHVAQDSSTFHDRDYMSFTGADYNYLDPNYLPGSS
ncbi:hypothetical protein HPB50_019841 [Hyalomma asiaticum]|uniref:Uncharacterized protein n=1 Tax=Hyalomma asiaticum TaxID=266040 RepID=A0ACB7RQS0_HYAAI|nr:hypothetical protein HPB50_019841 [Hyalomma asiaticum]